MTNRKPYSTDISDLQWAILKSFIPTPKGKKKPKPKPIYDPKHPHQFTARLLQQPKQYKCSP